MSDEPRSSGTDAGDDPLFEALALALRPVELSASQRSLLRARVLQRVLTEAPAGAQTLRTEAVEWIDLWPGLQARVLRVDEQAGRQTVLLRMQPGGEIPPHRHTQEEEFIVLEGECCIGADRLTAGDFHTAEAGSWHERTTTQTGVLALVRGEYPPPMSVGFAS
jgi:quercetin dioxygenase-like cupin family protein